MKPSRFIVATWLSLSITLLAAQQLSPAVLSAGGGFSQNLSGSLNFTIAEMTAIQTFSGSQSILTQGFQQPWDFGTGIADEPENRFLYGVYPNPTSGMLYLMIEYDREIPVDVILTDVMGRRTFQKELFHFSGAHVLDLDVSHLAQGLYFLAIRHAESKKVAGMHKIHIIK